MHILAVGAHAADMEFTCGAVVLAYTRAGHSATFLHCTPGEKGHPRLDPDTYAVQKVEEAKRVAAGLGATARFLEYKDAELLANEAVALAIADVIRDETPDIVITHPPHSIHDDHANTHTNTMRAIFLAGLAGIRRTLPAHNVSRIYYAENWEDMEGFVPDTYVDVSEVFDDWLDITSQYELFRGGISSFRYKDYYQALGVMRGCLGRAERAIALMRPPGWGRKRGKLPL